MTGLTDAEMVVLDHLSNAARAFFKLPEHHPNEIQAFADSIHHLQWQVMARAAIRWKPDYFTPMIAFESEARPDVTVVEP